MNIPAHSPIRIFGSSALVTVAALVAILLTGGVSAMAVACVLIIVELAFSFDNAIVNAKVLARLSPTWQRVFLTVGILIAVIGMRVVFPILIVMLTAHLSWSAVLDLALHHPTDYAEKLEQAHPSIAAFGGAFLLVLALQFFMNDNKENFWIKKIERPLARIGRFWLPGVVSAVTILCLALLPFNPHRVTALVAGLLGVATYILIQLVMSPLEKMETKTSGKSHLGTKASLLTLLYLEILDASFSFDSVIGAFAITDKVLIIAAGLGVGAIWVRSLTVYMVRRKTLENYVFLEHGAHYTIAVLATMLLLSLFLEVPDIIAGLLGIGLITASIIASKRFNHTVK